MTFESLETRGMLTTLMLNVNPFVYEDYGPASVYLELSRFSDDISQPLEVALTSSDETEAVVQASVTIPADETTVLVLVDMIDDTSLDGDQFVFITATAGPDWTDALLFVQDAEYAEITLDQTAVQPGGTLTGTVSVSVTDHTESLFVPIVSSRPDEVASISVEIPAGAQSAPFAIPVIADENPEGPHTVTFQVAYDAGFFGDGSNVVTVTDPGITTLQSVADGHATDTDKDGAIFETVATHFHSIITHAASPSGSFGETRGILEFDASTIPAGAVVESAFLTLDLDGASHIPGVDTVLEVYAYAGNGVVESADANQTSVAVGQLTLLTDDPYILGSYAIELDIPTIQALVNAGGYLGITTKMQPSPGGSVNYHSKEFFRTSSRPSLHLVLAHPPIITSNSLNMNEGETVVLSAANLAATDADSGSESLTFTVSNVSGGQFLVDGTPATSFTQGQIAAGEVAFAHDGSEFAPSYAVEVSDGTYADGPYAASISFTNVNDNAPGIPIGQTFSVSEAAENGTNLGTVALSDADLPGDALAVSITAGNGGGVFAIDNAGALTVADRTLLDFETTTSYALTISVFDGVNTSNQVVTVNVLDVAETKFYVVDDASTNRTYEYAVAGTTIENYTLTSANSAPRGAASTAAGDRVWVIDANRKVYVYTTSGGLLGSWTAGTMSSTATPEGIATNGTDVWIVDSKSDKVFKYAGAASRLSGSQNAASSFNLNGSNTSPKDVVTDGASLWVVNDSSTDKVFKYTVAGSLVGSWTIGSANSKPTGLTIDPANVSDIWIVDSGTDLIYQYTGAASRTSGSQTAAASFALATGNTNPQGIADPPAGQSLLQNRQPSSGPSVSHRIPEHAAVTREAAFLTWAHESTPAKKHVEPVTRDSVTSDRAFDSYRAAKFALPNFTVTRPSGSHNERESLRPHPDNTDEQATDSAFETPLDGTLGLPNQSVDKKSLIASPGS